MLLTSVTCILSSKIQLRGKIYKCLKVQGEKIFTNWSSWGILWQGLKFGWKKWNLSQIQQSENDTKIKEWQQIENDKKKTWNDNKVKNKDAHIKREQRTKMNKNERLKLKMRRKSTT